jgi:tetratricopeptide (TPR) repeat protein
LRDPPEEDGAMGTRARELVGQGNLAAALNVVEDALRATPASFRLLLDRADLLRSLGRGEALAVIEDLLKRQPDHPGAWYQRGLILGRFLEPCSGGMERLDPQRQLDAVASFDRAIALRPSHAESWLYRARTLQALAHSTQATLRALAGVQRQHPREDYGPALAHHQRQFWLFFGRAWESFEHILELHPHDAHVWLELGRHLMDLEPGFEDSAAAAFARAASISPALGEAPYELARLADRAGDRAAAERLIEAALQADPGLRERAGEDFPWLAR